MLPLTSHTECRKPNTSYRYTLHTIFLTTLLTLPQLAFAGSCSTKECHGKMTEYKYMHSPAAKEECLRCHEKLAGSQTANAPDTIHPTAQGAEFTLIKQGEALCLQCHDSMADKYEHGPAAAGACTTCHNPHGSSQEAFLHTPLQQLCLGCHEDFATDMKKAAFIHSAIGDRDCSACHQPHSSGFPYLLKGETSASCFECHTNIEEKYKSSLHKHAPLYSEHQCANCHSSHYSNYPALLKWNGNDTCFHCHSTAGAKKDSPQPATSQIDVKDKKFIHEPIKDTGCSACHDAHGSKFGSLLNKPYPSTFYAGLKKDTYDLCFQCHDRELLTERDLTTNFRNGSTNLHNIHVADPRKGRTCKACHNLHASDGEKLINLDGIPFGGWNIPIRFEATATGGSCMPGCHRTLRYDRNKPADNSKEAEKKETPETEENIQERLDDEGGDVKQPKLEKLDDEGNEGDDVIEPKPITRHFKPQTQNLKPKTA